MTLMIGIQYRFEWLEGAPDIHDVAPAPQVQGWTSFGLGNWWNRASQTIERSASRSTSGKLRCYLFINILMPC